MKMTYDTPEAAREAMSALPLDTTEYRILDMGWGGGWTWAPPPSALELSRKGKLYRTRRLAKKALKAHPAWGEGEKRYLRIVQYENGRWSWMK